MLACAWAALRYRTGLDNPLVFDDRTTVLLNPSLASWWDLRAVLRYDPVHPLVNFTYAIDRAVSGHSALGYHATNGILHVFVVGLLYGWCTRALTDQGHRGGRSGADPPTIPDWAAFFAAGIFGLHPLMGSAVGYVTARTELIAALGCLASLVFARRAIVLGARTPAAIACAFGVVAVVSSSAAMALPLIVLAYDAWVLEAPGWHRRAAQIYMPAMAIVLVLAGWQFREAPAADIVPPRGPVTNLLTESIVAWRYLGLFVVPRGLSPLHDVHWATGLLDPLALLALAGLLALVVAAIGMRTRAPLVSFGLIWFAATLTPTTSMVPLREAMAEPRMYLPAAGLLMAMASLFARPLAQRASLRAAGTAVLVVLASLSSARISAMDDPVDVWREAARRAPRAWQAHLELAESLREAGRCDEARDEYLAAGRLNDRLPARAHLGAPCASGGSR